MTEPNEVEPHDAESTWHEANQQFLVNEFDRLATYFSDKPNKRAVARLKKANAELAASMSPHPPLMSLVDMLELTEFERDVVLLCAGVELDATIAALCAEGGTDGAGGVSFGLALRVLPHSHWSAVSHGGPLRVWRLVELLEPSWIARSPLRIDERILHHLVGVDDVDERLAHIVRPSDLPGPLAASHLRLANRITGLWRVQPDRDALALVQLVGPDADTSISVASVACRSIGLQLLVAHHRSLPTSPDEIDRFVRLWEREAALSSLALFIDGGIDDGLDRQVDGTIERIVRAIDGFVFHASAERRPGVSGRLTYTLDVERPTEIEQDALWRDRIGESVDGFDDVDAAVAQLVAHFDLWPSSLDKACLDAAIDRVVDDSVERDADGNDDEPAGATTRAALWNAVRTQGRVAMSDLARRIDARASWTDLVATDDARTALESIVAQVRHRTTVYRDWGFSDSLDRAMGVSALFAGPSGTGKTMAAEVVAHELELDLFAIDLSALVSKYIGETEKNLRRVFEAAESSGAVLLFDEADALFGRRSEVKDSHDRHANIEVSYLLQRMERYRGIAILTSNMKEAVDSAFLRRLGFIVEFPFPDSSMRRSLWERAFPASTPVDGLDFELLRQLEVSGGQVRNIARTAAFMAADEGSPVSLGHIRRAAGFEYAKSDRHVSPAEVKGWQ